MCFKLDLPPLSATENDEEAAERSPIEYTMSSASLRFPKSAISTDKNAAAHPYPRSDRPLPPRPAVGDRGIEQHNIESSVSVGADTSIVARGVEGQNVAPVILKSKFEEHLSRDGSSEDRFNDVPL